MEKDPSLKWDGPPVMVLYYDTERTVLYQTGKQVQVIWSLEAEANLDGSTSTVTINDLPFSFCPRKTPCTEEYRVGICAVYILTEYIDSVT